VDTPGRLTEDNEKRKYKDPEVGECLGHLRKSKEAKCGYNRSQ
jgi:hypothetical protein